MSKNANLYPPEDVAAIDERCSDIGDKAFETVARKYRVDAESLIEMVSEAAGIIARQTMRTESIGTVPTGSGFKAVNPQHFRKLENLRLHHFFNALLIDGEAFLYADHELSLMVLEIKELRAVLLRQFNYNWTEHRKHFPLIAQTGI